MHSFHEPIHFLKLSCYIKEQQEGPHLTKSESRARVSLPLIIRKLSSTNITTTLPSTSTWRSTHALYLTLCCHASMHRWNHALQPLLHRTCQPRFHVSVKSPRLCFTYYYFPSFFTRPQKSLIIRRYPISNNKHVI